jgi:hypothetical protein
LGTGFGGVIWDFADWLFLFHGPWLVVSSLQHGLNFMPVTHPLYFLIWPGFWNFVPTLPL